MIFIIYGFFLVFIINSIPCQSLKCYECSGHVSCGQGETDLIVDCSGKCMVYLNVFDSNTVVRRCCTSDCGLSESIGNYEGRMSYFCSSDLCNEAGSEVILPNEITLSSTIITTTISSTQMTTSITRQTSLQCYDCSGLDCGREGSTLSMNCPTCMVYRNPDDQTKIERRCCWQNCGPSFSVNMYNGIQTYFCSYDKCNRNGAENILSRPVTRSSTTQIIMSTTSSPVSCTLNCKNGGVLEKVDGCFCYCLEKTNGRECENFNCVELDDNDPDLCIPDNRSLCDQSEIFTYKCLHLCGKC